jgi:hypothetical protein
MFKIVERGTLALAPMHHFYFGGKGGIVGVASKRACSIEDMFGDRSLRASLVSSMLNVNKMPFTYRIRGLFCGNVRRGTRLVKAPDIYSVIGYQIYSCCR